MKAAANKLARNHDFDGDKLIAWRKELRAGRTTNALAEIIFKNGLARLGEFGRDDLRQLATVFMGRSVRHRTQ
jgi:hypothetical protein